MDDNYANRLRSVRDMKEDDMGKFKHLFAAFGPKINQSMIKHFCKERLRGNDFLWCSDLNAHLVDTYGYVQPHVSISLGRLTKLGILIKKRDGMNKRYVYYSLSPNFREITKALYILIHMLPSIQKTDK